MQTGSNAMRQRTASLAAAVLVGLFVAVPNAGFAAPAVLSALDGDADGDGVADGADWCATRPGPAANHGCPNSIHQVSADIDDDGNGDVVAVSRGDDDHPTVSWFRSTGTGVVAPKTLRDLPAPAWKVSGLKFAAGDFTGDGNDDLFAASGGAGPLSFYFLASTGSALSEPVLVKQPDPQLWSWDRLEFFPADVDGDEKDDLIAVSTAAGDAPDIVWFRSTGTGLADPVSLLSLAPGWKVSNLKFATGDFNDDGRDDLFAASGSETEPVAMQYLLSTGRGLAAPVLVAQPDTSYWHWDRLQFLAGDHDGDGRDDIVAVSRAASDGPEIHWFRSTASGLAAPALLASPDPQSWKVSNLQWAIMDLNGDDRDDLFAASGSAGNPVSLYVFRSAGKAGFGAPVLLSQPDPASWLWDRLQF